MISRLPVEPTGWPSAIAPPLTLTLLTSSSSVMLLTFAHDRHHRRERLVDLDDVDVGHRHAGHRRAPSPWRRPDRRGGSRDRCRRGTGRRCGPAAGSPRPWPAPRPSRARPRRRRRSATLLPAVWMPSGSTGLERGERLRSRLPQPLIRVTTSRFAVGVLHRSTGMISRSKRPSVVAVIAFCCDTSPRKSTCSRVMPRLLGDAFGRRRTGPACPTGTRPAERPFGSVPSGASTFAPSLTCAMCSTPHARPMSTAPAEIRLATCGWPAATSRTGNRSSSPRPRTACRRSARRCG